MTDFLAHLVVAISHGVPLLAAIALTFGWRFSSGLLWASAALTVVLLGMFVHAFNRSLVPYKGETLVRYTVVLLASVIMAAVA